MYVCVCVYLCLCVCARVCVSVCEILYGTLFPKMIDLCGYVEVYDHSLIEHLYVFWGAYYEQRTSITKITLINRQGTGS